MFRCLPASVGKGVEIFVCCTSTPYHGRVQRLACTAWHWRLPSHFDAPVNNASSIPDADWAVAEIKTQVKLAEILGADAVRGTEVKAITWIIQVELEILGDLERDVGLPGDMMSLRLGNTIFEINVPGSIVSCVVS